MVSTRLLLGSLTVAVLGAAGLVWASWNRGVTIVLRNADSAALRDVTIHVTGCDYPVGNISVGSTRRVLVDPTGASHVEILQRQAEGRGRVLVPCYFETGFSGALEIDLRCDSALVVGNSISVGYW